MNEKERLFEKEILAVSRRKEELVKLLKSKIRIGRAIPVSRFLLILLGLIFLLNNFGILPWNIWSIIWRIWPVLLIVVCFQLISGRFWLGGSFLALVVVIVFLLVLSYSFFVSGIARSQGWRQALPRIFSQWFLENERKSELSVFSDDCPNVEEMGLYWDIGIASANLTDNKSDNLFDLKANYVEGFGQPELVKNCQNDFLEVQVRSGSRKRSFFPFWQLRQEEYNSQANLGVEDVKSNLNLIISLGILKSSLERVHIGRINLKVGAGKAEFAFGEDSVPLDLDLNVGVGTVKIKLPVDIGFEIIYDLGLGDLKVDGVRLRGHGNYHSLNFETAEKQIRLKTSVGVGTAQIERN